MWLCLHDCDPYVERVIVWTQCNLHGDIDFDFDALTLYHMCFMFVGRVFGIGLCDSTRGRLLSLGGRHVTFWFVSSSSYVQMLAIANICPIGFSTWVMFVVRR